MTGSAASRLAWVIALIIWAATAAEIVVVLTTEAPRGPWVIPGVVSSVVGLVIVTRSRNVIGWLLLGFALLGGVGALLISISIGYGEGDWPLVEAIGHAMAVAGTMLVPVILLRFPDGGLLTISWRLAEVVVGIGAAAGVLASLLNGGFGGDLDQAFAPSPLYEATQPVGDIASAVFFGLMVVSFGLGATSVILRFRRSRGVARRQLKWLAYGTAVGSVVVAAAGTGGTDSLLQATVVAVGLAMIPAAIGVAILRYNLFDIDVVISRSIVFGALAVFITAVYAVVVGTLGSLIAGSDVVLAIVATTIVAVLFEPARDRVQRMANRMVYGKRAVPYEVLSDLTRSLPNAEEESGLLDRMAFHLRAGTGAERAQVWLTSGTNGLVLAASDPELSDAGVNSIDELDGVVVPIEHDGETLGALTVESPPGTPLRPAELRLASDLAGSAALVVTKLRLDTDLQRTAAELASSRRRLVDAQDSELRRLERLLQDGAVQDILGLKLAIALAARTAQAEGSQRTADLLTGLAGETQTAIDEIHSLATGLYPALLESEGLEPALRAMAASAPVSTNVTGTIPRLDREIEIAAFYTITEATTNAIKHANPPITISLTHIADELTFTIADAGPGFDRDTTIYGSGLLNMIDRLDTIGGTLTIATTPQTDTTITAMIPTRDTQVPVAAPLLGQSSVRSSRAAGPNSDFEMNATAPASIAESS
ncbi:MAG: sensor histidine kinase [Acidimicrobiales bacterium]